MKVLVFWQRSTGLRCHWTSFAKLEMTQVHLARILKVNQAAVSKMERRTDMYISTLQDFIRAMGGELKITARFPDGTVEINQFEAVKKATAGSKSCTPRAGLRKKLSFGAV